MCTSVQPNGSSPCVQRSIIAATSLAAISVLVFGILAILVSCQTIHLPEQLSMATLLIAGGSGLVFFGIIALVLKYCRGSGEGKSEAEEPGGSNLLMPDGSGRPTGANGGNATGSAVTVEKGNRKNPLD